MYDTRDFIPNPYKGTYAKIEQTFFPKFLGNCYSFQRTDLQIRHYDELWKGAVLAYDLNGTFKSGNTPWSMVAHLGKETLPSYGLGYRWEFKNRVNIRLDYGIGKGQSSFYFNINEAF